MNKVIVAGSRTISDMEWVHSHLSRILANTEPGEIVSGGATGPDTFGEWWAEATGWDTTIFLAEWDKYGRSAGYKRNKVMAEYSTHLIAFYDGTSKGTRHMIDLAKQAGLEVRIVRSDTEGA